MEECFEKLPLLANVEAFFQQEGQQELTMSTALAITRMKMASMAQVFLAQRVRSIQVEKATSFLGKAYKEWGFEGMSLFSWAPMAPVLPRNIESGVLHMRQSELTVWQSWRRERRNPGVLCHSYVTYL